MREDQGPSFLCTDLKIKAYSRKIDFEGPPSQAHALHLALYRQPGPTMSRALDPSDRLRL